MRGESTSLPPRPRRDRLAGAAAAAIAIAAASIVLHRLQFSSYGLVDTDGYFHIKFSYLMARAHGRIAELPWLHFTIHRDYYRDHHFLQHVLLISAPSTSRRRGAGGPSP
jgi:hypothetical protein